MYLLYTYDFVILNSLTHSRKILLIVLQIGKQEIGKAKNLSAPLSTFTTFYKILNIMYIPVTDTSMVASFGTFVLS
jgi:hypothetical protein